MTHYLSIEPSKWAETIEAHGVECLTSKVTTKNVRHVLSTATIRAPQKSLCSAVAPLIGDILGDKNGIVLLTALVEFGTAATVEKVAEGLLSASPNVWTFQSDPDNEVIQEAAQLLERLIYRTDATGENCQKIVSALRGVPASKLFQTAFLLPATARLVVVDSSFTAELCKNNAAKKTFGEACTTAALRSGAEFFVRTVLEARTSVEQMSVFVLGALQHLLTANSPRRPSEALLLTVAAKGSPSIVEKIMVSVSSWPNLHEMATKEGFAKIVATLLERVTECKAGVTIVQSVFASSSDIDSRINSRKAAQLHLLSVLQSRRMYIEALNKTTGSDQTNKLRSAKVLYTSATVPKAAATQSAIMAKLNAHQISSVATKTRKGSKRRREE